MKKIFAIILSILQLSVGLPTQAQAQVPAGAIDVNKLLGGQVIGQAGVAQQAVGQQQPGWLALPFGRRGNCAALTGQPGAFQQQTTRVGNASYVTCFGWNAGGFPAGILDPGGFLTEFRFDLLGRSTLVRDTSNEELQQTYNNKSQLQQLLQTNNFNPNNDPLNMTSQFEYDSVGNPSRQNISGFLASRRHYTPDGEVKAAVGPDGALAGIFSIQGGLLDSTGLGLVNNTGEPTTESLGRTRYQYDPQGRPSQIIDGVGNVTTLVYTPQGRVQQMIFPDRSSIYNRYNAAGTLRWREVRDRNDVTLQTIGFTYDNMGRATESTLTKQGNANTWKTRWAYQDNGLTAVTTQFLNDVQYASSTSRSDGLGRPLSQDLPGAGSISSTYNSRGLLETLQQSATGRIRFFNYDASGRLEWVVDGLDNYTHYQFNGLGNLGKILSSGATTVQLQYDTKGRLTSRDTGAFQHIGYAYDNAGRLQGLDFGAFPSFRKFYQADNGLLDYISIQNQTVFDIVTRNLNGLPTRWSDANGVTFSMDYDVMSRPILLTAERAGGRQFRAWGYQDNGQLKYVAESSGAQPNTFSEVTQGPQSGILNAALAMIKRLLGLATFDSHLKSVIYFTYDSAGNIVEENRWLQGRWLPTAINYAAIPDALWQTSIYPSGFRMEKKADSAGRLVLVNGRLADGTLVGKATFNYVANSLRLDRILFGTDESQERYTYDAAGRVTSVSVFKTPAGAQESQLARIDYKYSPQDQLIAKKEQILPVAGQNLAKGFASKFDELGRIIAWSSVTPAQVDGIANNSTAAAPINADAMQRYFFSQRGDRQKASTRDTAGALLGTALIGRAFEYTRRFDYALQTASQSGCSLTPEGARNNCDNNVATVDVAFNPDGGGNLQAMRAGNAAGPTYIYNLFGQLVQVNDPANNNRDISYYYDGLGRVISRKVRENLRTVADQQFIWDGSALSEVREVTARNASGEVTQEIIYSYLYGQGSSDLLGSYDRRWMRYHHSHPDGSTFLLTYNGDVTQWFRYSPFGETRVVDWINNAETQRTLAESKTLRLFSGALIDPLTGFYFLGSWYDPVHGQSLSAGGSY